MNRPKGYVIPLISQSGTTRSTLHKSSFYQIGKVRVDFYDDVQNYLESHILKQGDVILLAYGGHGFEMLEPSEMIEVKQGPYAGDGDKTRFEPISANQVRLKN